MTTLCLYDPANEAHDPGPNHSERSARLTEIVKSLKNSAFPGVIWPVVAAGSIESIRRAHSDSYIAFVFNSVPMDGYVAIEVNEVQSNDDGGEVTVLSPHSGTALLMSIGQLQIAVDAIMNETATNAFCLTRPPGHHALRDKAMGFCVFNNAVIAARYAQDHYKLKRVAIVDFDVHHGNGTQAIVERDPSIFFASIHQSPLWPETGSADETGCGNIFNVPVPPGVAREQWMASWRTVLSRLETESFDLLLISAGFDAHQNDPKGGQNLEDADYYQMTHDLVSIAQRTCNGRVITVLEGGYDVQASAASAVEALRALAEA